MSQDRVKVLRVVEYEGPRDWVEQTVRQSIHGEKRIHASSGDLVIRAATLGTYPEILEEQVDASSKEAAPPDAWKYSHGGPDPDFQV